MTMQWWVVVWLLLGPEAPAGSAQASTGQIHWAATFAEAAKTAAAESKLIVAYIYAGWCPWCKRMDRETWSDPAVVAESRNHVFVKLDGENDADGARLRQRFAVRGFPMVLVLNPDGSEFERLEGFLQPQAFLERLKAALSDPESFGNLKAAVAKNTPDLPSRLKLGRLYYGKSALAEAQKCFEDIVRQDPKNKAEVTDDALFHIALCQAVQNSIQPAIGTLDTLRHDFPKSDSAPKAAMLSGELLLQTGRKEDGYRRLEEFLKDYPGHPMAERARRLLTEK